MHPLTNALALLIEVVFDALLVLFVLRLLAELWRADFHNPISQFLYRYTNPVLAPLRRHMPNWNRWNLSAVLVVWLLALLEWLAKLLLFYTDGQMPHMGGWVLAGTASLVDFVLFVYVILLFVWALGSMIVTAQKNTPHPLIRFVAQLVEPAIRPLSRRVPTLGGIDFSPAIAILVLMFARILITEPLLAIGIRMATGGS